MAICWYAAVIRVTYVGLLGMASEGGGKRGKYSIVNSQSSMKIMVKKRQLGMGPLAALLQGWRGEDALWCCPAGKMRYMRSCLPLLEHICWFALALSSYMTDGTNNFRTVLRKQC